MILKVTLLLTMAASQALAPPVDPDVPIKTVRFHPLFADSFACSEHWEGQLDHLGDALGADCFVTQLVETPGGGRFSRTYANDGLENEDWYSYQAPVLAPFDGVVLRVHENSITNIPGETGSPPAGHIVLRREDDVFAVLAHIEVPLAAEGDTVEAGQILARVGNNGFGRAPHIHVGAWRGEMPLQIVWDLRAMGMLMEDGQE